MKSYFNVTYPQVKRNDRIFMFEAEKMVEEGFEIKHDFGRALVRPHLPKSLRESLDTHTSFDDWSNYSDWKGYFPLRERICEIYSPFKEGGVDVDQVIITAGATDAKNLYLMARKNIQITTFPPFYFDHAPSLFVTEFDPSENIVMGKVPGAVLISNPWNPRGIIFDEKNIKEEANRCSMRNIDFLVDRAYFGFVVTDKKDIVAPSISYDFLSVGKMLGMTDLRVGALIIPKEEIDPADFRYARNKLNISVSLHEQKRALSKLGNLENFLDISRKHLFKSGDDFLKVIQETPHLTPASGGNAGIFWIEYDLEMKSRDLCRRLLKEDGIYVMPGSDFGESGNYFRMCIGTHTNTDYADDFVNAFRRIGA